MLALHVSTICLFGALIAASDLRLLGWAYVACPISDLINQLRWPKRLAFVLSATFGFLLFACKGSPAPCVSYLNPAAFVVPPAGMYGDMGIGALRAPGFWEWDQTISRAFPITERTHLEFRAEAFNVTNSVRLGIPVQTLGGTFGTIVSDQSTTGSVSPTGDGGRVVQFAMKYVF